MAKRKLDPTTEATWTPTNGDEPVAFTVLLPTMDELMEWQERARGVGREDAAQTRAFAQLIMDTVVSHVVAWGNLDNDPPCTEENKRRLFGRDLEARLFVWSVLNGVTEGDRKNVSGGGQDSASSTASLTAATTTTVTASDGAAVTWTQ